MLGSGYTARYIKARIKSVSIIATNDSKIKNKVAKIMIIADFLEKYLKTKNAILFKFDPLIEYTKHDKEGKAITEDNEQDFVDFLKKNDVKHRGFTIGYTDEAQFRWSYALDIKSKTFDDLTKDMNSRCKRSIKKAEKYPLKIKDVTDETIKDFKDIMESTAERQHHGDRTLSYYQTLKDKLKDIIRMCLVYLDKEKFLEEFDNKWKDIIFKPVYMVDYDFNIQEISFNFEEIEKLSEYIYSIGKLNEEGIWGQDMPESEIIVKNLPVDNIQLLSPDKKPTLKISCEGIDFMKFKSSEEEYNKLKGSNFGTVFINLLGKPNINSWGGRTTPQILINDYEIVGNKYSF